MADSDVRPDTYKLWTRFSLPTEGGTKDSVAVRSGTGTNLVAAYTLMIKLIVTQLWALIVLAGMVYSIKIHKSAGNSGSDEKVGQGSGSDQVTVQKEEHDVAIQKKENNVTIGVISASIFISKSSAPTVLKLTIKHFLRAKHIHIRYFSLLWMVAAAIFLSLGYSLPIIITRYLVIGHAAPVAPEAIYVPSVGTDTRLQYKVTSLQSPAALRAAGEVDATTAQRAIVDAPKTSVNQNGLQMSQFGYRYNLSGVDFGLQHAPDLLFNVEGSCITEYGWLFNHNETNEGLQDDYALWNDSSNPVTMMDFNAGPPYANFFPFPNNTDDTNHSFSIVVNSLNRISYLQGFDPWYLTDNISTFNEDLNSSYFLTLGRRPALSCWETAIWSYNGQNESSAGLKRLPGLRAPIDALSSAFGFPMILIIGQALDRKALQCSADSSGRIIDAAKCSVQSDLTKLIFVAYLASKNALSDFTTFGPEQPDIPNLAKDDNGAFFPGAADYVIYSKDVATLSIRVLIVIPTVLCGLFLLVSLATYKFGVGPVYKKSMSEYWKKWAEPV